MRPTELSLSELRKRHQELDSMLMGCATQEVPADTQLVAEYQALCEELARRTREPPKAASPRRR